MIRVLRGFNSIRMTGLGAFILLLLISLAGCHDFFAEKPTEIQSQMILRDLSKIVTIPDANLVTPEIYRKPPRILKTEQGVKLFYFCRQLQVEQLQLLMKEQFNYRMSINKAVNQLVLECPTEEEVQVALEFLAQVDVAPIQVRIDCMVSELYTDVTMDWETTIRIEDLFGSNVTLSGKDNKPAFPGASLRDAGRNELGLKVGYSDMTGNEFSALIDLLVSRGYLKIMMNPTLEVVNGQQAKIESVEQVPLSKEVVTKQQEPYMTTVYEDVIDSLEITPYVYADGYIGLETSVIIGSKSTPEGVLQIPIVTERKITNKENRIRQGESMIIGGIRKTEKRSVIRGVPFLKDIPILGVLFSSKDFEERAKEIIFVITPSISRGGSENKDMVEWMRRKHEPPVGPKLHEQLMDIVEMRKEKEDPNQARNLYAPGYRDYPIDDIYGADDYIELDPIQHNVPSPHEKSNKNSPALNAEKATEASSKGQDEGAKSSIHVQGD